MTMQAIHEAVKKYESNGKKINDDYFLINKQWKIVFISKNYKEVKKEMEKYKLPSQSYFPYSVFMARKLNPNDDVVFDVFHHLYFDKIESKKENKKLIIIER